MPRPKVSDADFIDFLIATPKQATATEAQRTQPPARDPRVAAAAHDAYTRLLHRLEPDAQVLWEEVRADVRLGSGMLVLDDSVLDKPYARKMDLVHHQWSGKHHDVVKGIGLLTLLWTDGDRRLPCDYRLYDKVTDGKTKNDHFRELLDVARERGFAPECVLFDGWYSGLENLKHVRSFGWHWLTRLKSNRRVNPDRSGLRAVSACEIAATGTVVHLEGYGLVKVFRIGAKDGTADHWATDDLTMDDLGRVRLADASWQIEEYHRGLKQTTNVERCQCRVGRAQRGHIGLALRAFVILEQYCFRTGVSCVAAKREILHEAIRRYRMNPYHRRREGA
jgi:putative transposase